MTLRWNARNGNIQVRYLIKPQAPNSAPAIALDLSLSYLHPRLRPRHHEYKHSACHAFVFNLFVMQSRASTDIAQMGDLSGLGHLQAW